MRFLILIVAFFISAPVMAADALDSLRFKDENWARGYLQAIEAGPVILSRADQYDVPPPPENDSAEVAEELAFLHEIAAQRDAETIARIHRENVAVSPVQIFIEDGLIGSDNNKVIELLDIINRDHAYFILERKKHFQRARPSELDPSLTTVIPNPPYAAYPSGHAAQSYMVALVLSDFDPENAARYKKLAHDIAFRREIAGIHFKSDSAAGVALAEDIYKKLRGVPAFEEKYTQAKLTYIKPKLEKKED